MQFESIRSIRRESVLAKSNHFTGSQSAVCRNLGCEIVAIQVDSHYSSRILSYKVERNRLALCNNTARINANYGGPYLQTQQTILDTQHNIFETQVNVCETQHKISESQDKIVETHNKVVETQHKIIETQHKIVASFRKLCLTAKENHVACQTRTR